MIYLNKNVFLVNGKQRSCLYDLNKKQLFSLNRETTEALKFLLMQRKKHKLTENELNKLKTFLLENNLISDVEPKNNMQTYNEMDYALIEITKGCNHKCVHCYNEEQSCSGQMEMSLTDFKKVIDELVAIGTINRIQLIGGEPLLLGERLYPMLNYVKGKFEKVSIFSNLTVLTDEMVLKLKEANISLINTTIFSYIPEENDKATQIPGSFERTKEALLKLKNAGIKVSAHAIKMNNVEIGCKNTDLFDLGVYQDKVRLSGRGNLKLYNRQLLKEKCITESRFNSPLYPSFVLKNMYGNRCFCHMVYIDCNLNVFPCVMERRFMHGNLNKGHLKDIIKPKILAFNQDKVKGCKDCEYRYACSYCPPDSLSKKVGAKPWFCTYNQKTGKWTDFDKWVSDLEKKIKIKFS